MFAAIANAIFDATGARLRQGPFTPERVKAAMQTRATSTTAKL
jgi:CO/xanthine dehydrogenase Mo-binding subunit